MNSTNTNPEKQNPNVFAGRGSRTSKTPILLARRLQYSQYRDIV